MLLATVKSPEPAEPVVTMVDNPTGLPSPSKSSRRKVETVVSKKIDDLYLPLQPPSHSLLETQFR